MAPTRTLTRARSRFGHGWRSGSATGARPRGRCSRRQRAAVQRRPARQARRWRRGLGQWASATATNSATSRPWAGAWRTRVAVASWSPSRAAAATARRSRWPAGAGPEGSGGCLLRPVAVAVGVGWRLDGQVPAEAAQAPWAAWAASPRSEHRARPQRAARTGPGRPWHAPAPGSRPRWCAGDHQVLEPPAGDVPGFALAGLLHGAGLDPGPLTDRAELFPVGPWLSSRQVCSTTFTTPAARRRVSGSGMAWMSSPPEQAPDEAALLGLIPEAVGGLGGQVQGAAGVPDPLHELDGGLAAPGDGRELVEEPGWRPRLSWACGGWRSGRSPPAAAAWQASASWRPARYGARR